MIIDGKKANIKILQEFITVIMGIGLSNVIVQFINHYELNNGVLLWDLHIGDILLVLSIILLIVRFYHGNMRILVDLYFDEDSHKNIRLNQAIDSIVIIIQGLVFSVIGLFEKNPVNLRWLIILVYIIDVLWLLIYMSNSSDRQSNRSSVLKSLQWSAINGLSLLGIVLFQLLYLFGQVTEKSSGSMIAIIILAGSLYDYIKNKEFYFPSHKLTQS